VVRIYLPLGPRQLGHYAAVLFAWLVAAKDCPVQNSLGGVVIGGILSARAFYLYRVGIDRRWKFKSHPDYKRERAGFNWWATWLVGGALGALAVIGGIGGLLLCR
jgi:hypothetical protein